MRRWLRVLGFGVLAAVLGFATVWAFLAYTNPGMVMDFASVLQMCGIPLNIGR